MLRRVPAIDDLAEERSNTLAGGAGVNHDSRAFPGQPLLTSTVILEPRTVLPGLLCATVAMLGKLVAGHHPRSQLVAMASRGESVSLWQHKHSG